MNIKPVPIVLSQPPQPTQSKAASELVLDMSGTGEKKESSFAARLAGVRSEQNAVVREIDNRDRIQAVRNTIESGKQSLLELDKAKSSLPQAANPTQGTINIFA